MTLNVPFSRKLISRILIASIATLVFINILGQLLVLFVDSDPDGLVRLFVRLIDLDQEGNIPTWYSSLTLLLCAVLSSFIGMAKKRLRDPHARGWLALSLLFLYLSIDEASAIHEIISDGLDYTMQWTEEIFFYYTWIVLAIVGVVILAVASRKLLAELPVTIRNRFVLGAALYVGGALVLEVIGNYYEEIYGWPNVVYFAFVNLEELFEMSGVAVLICALLAQLERDVTGLYLVLTPGQEPTARQSSKPQATPESA